MNPNIKTLLRWVVPAFVPILLLLTVTRLLMTPAFINLEYGMPNFPDDTYGFSLQDRQKWAPIALEYLLNDADISFLADLEFEEGSPLYNEREMNHMRDVKRLTKAALNFWYATGFVFLALGVWARRADWWQDYKEILASGGKITTVILAVLIAFIMISFNAIFVGFHSIFFTGDTWLFLFSDTLIRLFPMRFWQDTFIFLGVLTFSGGVALWYFLGRPHIQKE